MFPAERVALQTLQNSKMRPARGVSVQLRNSPQTLSLKPPEAALTLHHTASDVGKLAGGEETLKGKHWP